MSPEELPVLQDPDAPSCSLDAPGLAEQLERYATIGRSVLALERTPRSLTAILSPAVDPELVERTLAVERECCEFFDLDFDQGSRRLTVAVATDEMASAVDAIATALGAASR